MHYCQYQPSAALAPYFECFWTLETTADEPSELQRIVPDGCMEIVLHRGEPFSQVNGSKSKKQPVGLIAGQITRALLLQPSEAASVLGLRLKPASAFAWFGIPAHEFTNQTVDLDALPQRCRAVLNAAASTDTLKEALEAFVRESSRDLPSKPLDPQVTHAVRLLAESRGMIRIEQVAAAVNLSRRQLERRFQQHVGIAPKTLARILRFQNVFSAYQDTKDWVEAALQCGYFDQSHLIQDFHELAGQTPEELLRPASDLAGMFLRTSSHFSKTPRAASR